MKQSIIILAIVASLFRGISSFPAENHSIAFEIPRELVEQLIKDINANRNNFRLSEKDLEILHKNLKYELRDLNGDSTQEFLLHIDHSDWCGAGGNCSYWVYQKLGGGYKLLLEDKGLNVRHKFTNGYRDIESRVPMGFCAINVQRFWVTLYKYYGGRYQSVSYADRCISFVPKR
ncbi:MAG TPA: hypothetical protein VF791_16225 [Pyrinomonadaceae bacterium]